MSIRDLEILDFLFFGGTNLINALELKLFNMGKIDSPRCIGLVVTKDRNSGKIRVYLGACRHANQKRNIVSIIKYGQKMEARDCAKYFNNIISKYSD